MPIDECGSRGFVFPLSPSQGSPRRSGPPDPLVRRRVARLTAVLAELERTEKEYNRINQIGSTCEMRMAPQVEAIGGRCRAIQQ